ncbi:MAG: 1,4-dihydroxy-2-naphthoate polyprenyltransferase [Actinomycetota bacterium]|nr:1,4-dihydroxy-2-naphthoate polyprenyltransferase [Actinomycetota bacterium]
MGSGKSLLSEWVRLARPFSLTASAVPVLLGTALALRDGAFAWATFLVMLLASLLIQAATNMFNEFYDEKRGLDTAASVGIAGSIVAGRVEARHVLRGALACYAFALLLGLYLVAVAGWAIMLLQLVCMLCGYFYSGGSRPIAYTPAGEAAVFLFMGVLIVVAAYAVQTSSFPLDVAFASVPMGALVAAILLANNIRDLQSDRRGGRRTLPIVLGRKVGILVYRFLLVGSYAALVALIVFGVVPMAAVGALLSAPLALLLWSAISASTASDRLDATVKGTAGIHGIFGLLYVAGIWAASVF